jgi:hypothetical protein
MRLRTSPLLILVGAFLQSALVDVAPLTVDAVDADCGGSSLNNARFLCWNSTHGVKLWRQSGELVFVGGPGDGRYDFRAYKSVYVEGACVSALQPLDCRQDNAGHNTVVGWVVGLVAVCFCIFMVLLESQKRQRDRQSMGDTEDEAEQDAAPEPPRPERRAGGFEKTTDEVPAATRSSPADLKDVELDVIGASV